MLDISECSSKGIDKAVRLTFVLNTLGCQKVWNCCPKHGDLFAIAAQ